MSVLNNQSKTLGNYEKQVLLELDRELTPKQIAYILSVDGSHELLLCIITWFWDNQRTVNHCINEILSEFDLHVPERELECVAVLGYN